jgi:hypothetical protein
MPGTGTDAGETVGTCTAQKVHKDGLGPVIGSVPQRGIRTKNSMSGGAAPCFKVRPGFEAHAFGPESGSELLGDCGDERRLGLRTLS